MFRIDVADGRPPIVFEAGREEVLFERDLANHLAPRFLRRRFFAPALSSVPYCGDPVSKHEPGSKIAWTKGRTTDAGNRHARFGRQERRQDWRQESSAGD